MIALVPILILVPTFTPALPPGSLLRAQSLRQSKCKAVSSDEVRPGSMKWAREQTGKLPYGEESRRYRRTVYRHKDWLKHRSSTRLLKNLGGTFTSGVVRSLLSEVGAVVLVSLLVIVWNAVFFGYVDFLYEAHPGVFGMMPEFIRMTLPALPFTLSSPALGLLLVFRTNASYGRWMEARSVWGRIVSQCRNILRQAAVWSDVGGGDDEATELASRHLAELQVYTWAFARSLWAHLSDPRTEPRLVADLTQEMGPDAAAEVLRASHRPLRTLGMLSSAMDRLPMCAGGMPISHACHSPPCPWATCIGTLWAYTGFVRIRRLGVLADALSDARVAPRTPALSLSSTKVRPLLSLVHSSATPCPVAATRRRESKWTRAASCWATLVRPASASSHRPSRLSTHGTPRGFCRRGSSSCHWASMSRLAPRGITLRCYLARRSSPSSSLASRSSRFSLKSLSRFCHSKRSAQGLQGRLVSWSKTMQTSPSAQSHPSSYPGRAALMSEQPVVRGSLGRSDGRINLVWHTPIAPLISAVTPPIPMGFGIFEVVTWWLYGVSVCHGCCPVDALVSVV